MFNRYLVTKDIDNEEVLYLFIDNNFEFSKEFGNKRKKEKNKSLISSVINYIKDKKIKFNGKKIFLVSSGIIIGTIYFSQLNPINTQAYVEPKIEYSVTLEDFDNIKIPTKVETTDNKVNNTNTSSTETKTTSENKASTSTNTSTPKSNTGTSNTTTSKANTSTPNTTTQNNTTTTPPEENNTPSQPAENNTPSQPIEDNAPSQPIESTPPEPEEKEEIMYKNPVNVYRKDGSVQTMELEDFIVGVVSAEMPAEFNIEALKTQAVASRTYYLKAIRQNKKIYEISDGQQIYKDINTLKSFWGSSFDKYYTKIKSAVNSTEGKYISYNGGYIEAVYCSTNNGKTESSKDVWGNYYPYLISVDSPWDLSAPTYSKTIQKDLVLLSTLLGIDLTSESNIEILSRTDGDSIDKIKINDTVFTGIYLRNLLGLRSTDFDIDISGNIANITTRGYGHGVGISQYGANGMAKAGYNYVQILQHYYPGTQIR